MRVPKYKIGDVVYHGYFTTEYEECIACHQKLYDDDTLVIESRESTIVGISVREGFDDDTDGVNYKLSTDHWPYNEDALFLTAQEAEDDQREQLHKEDEHHDECKCFSCR